MWNRLESCIVSKGKVENMEIRNQRVVNRWNKVMNDICCEHITINTRLSELENNKQYYDIENGIDVKWLLDESKYWLSCYYESGNVRCDDRFYGEEEYKSWLSESGKLKRLIATLEKMENDIIVKW